MDTVPELRQRRASVSTKDSSEHAAPVLTQPHRRPSRMEPPSLMMNLNMSRRMSMYRRPSIAGSHRTDESTLRTAVQIKMQNTYRLEPDADNKFNSGKVEKALYSILESFLEGEAYEAKKCSTLAQNLTEHIKSRVKEMHFARYKLVCNVLIGQNASESVEFASRCIWNTATDTYASATYANRDLFAVASVFGLYFE